MSQKTIALYLQLHQPYRVKRYTIFDTAHDHLYFNDEGDSDTNNRRIFERVAEKSYRPMLTQLERLGEELPDFRFSLSVTGTFLEQAEAWAPDVIDTLKRLVASGNVELLAETYHHSLAFYYSQREFETQVNLHREKIFQTFGVIPSVFRNTELAYDDRLAEWAAEHGYKGILAEGWDAVLDWRSPNHLYRAAGTDKLALLLKNYRLSDDLAFRFAHDNWSAASYIDRLHHSDPSAKLINLFMDFETFGEHQWEDTGIFAFFSQFVHAWTADNQRFVTVSDAIALHDQEGELSMPETVTWADSERDLSAWTGNALQQEILKYIYALEHEVTQSGDSDLIADWRKLLTSDHAYYMSTKWHDDGNIHAYFSPYDSPYDAFLGYMNVVRDLRWRVGEHRKAL
ncbi:polysaccharide deacetylase family protein [Candidatus Mycosynbacter amalyticus]|uniref:Polysaccharide deacetylase family protein n=1 Tax=Candidatus Mycosynbacter amalyticus TaxID=2665156 RepID=A0A857MLW0_9BACT|nr:glycoside hydrolase family 57 protein [Candidatus Mycosynbacter amalyticus]QHN42795.1 polysaccharide deacetylase family protein [Candidatus Mycosynbacter amalyticus]